MCGDRTDADFPGEGLGAEPDAESPSLQPVLTYTVLPAGAESDTAGTSGAAKRGDAGHNNVNQDGAEHDAAKSGTGRNEENDTAGQTAADNSSPARPQFDDLTLHKVITALRELEDEDPLLHVVWVERLAEIHVQLMGAVQLEIIQQTLHDRFGLDVSFGPGSILYRETVTAPTRRTQVISSRPSLCRSTYPAGTRGAGQRSHCGLGPVRKRFGPQLATADSDPSDRA